MKLCTKCGVEKDLSDFFYQSKVKDRLHAQCKVCYKEHRKTYMAAHYEKYGEAYRTRAKIRRAKIKRLLQLRLIDYMSDKSCTVCGEGDIRVLEFDHIDATDKSFSIARGITNGLPWEIILEEMNKCQILCANCHKKRTASQFQWFKAMGLE